jgi:phospholipid-binding lipoprotein MlaA
MPGPDGGAPVLHAAHPALSVVRPILAAKVVPAAKVASSKRKVPGKNARIRFSDLNLRKAQPMDAGWSSTNPKDEGDAASGDLDEPTGSAEVNDPIEPVNRLVFAVNDAVDVIVLKPVATTYKFWAPEALRNAVRNFLRNLATPVTLLNDVLQGNGSRAGKTLARFALNTTIGFGGLGDPATEMGLQYHFEDFGQTLAVHGVGEGPYLVLPLLGPSTLRHTVGRGVDFATDPLTYVLWKKPIYYAGGRKGAEILDNRTELLKTIDDLKETSVDYYATIRSTYRQNRLSEINNGEVDIEDLPDISDLE